MVRVITDGDVVANATTTIRIKRTTKEKLSGLGRKGQTYDEIINDLIDSLGGE